MRPMRNGCLRWQCTLCQRNSTHQLRFSVSNASLRCDPTKTLPSEPQPPAVIQPDVTDDSLAQYFLFALLSFTLDTIKLVLGFPETDGEHIAFLYGQPFANVYMFIGASMGAGKFWTILAGCCFLWLTMTFDVLQIFRTVSLWLRFEFGQAKTSFIKMYKLFPLVYLWFEHYGRDVIDFCATLSSI